MPEAAASSAIWGSSVGLGAARAGVSRGMTEGAIDGAGAVAGSTGRGRATTGAAEGSSGWKALSATPGASSSLSDESRPPL